jgi:hypothetical protein
MTRAWRVEYEGAFYHLLYRGRTLFFSARRSRIGVDVEKKVTIAAGLRPTWARRSGLIGFSKPGASHPVPPATIGALRAPVFYTAYGGKIQATRYAGGR